MKRLMTLMLGLAFLGTTVVVFADDASTTTKKTTKTKATKTKKTTAAKTTA